MHYQRVIDMATMEFQLPPRNTRLPLLFGLTKIHNSNCPLRPIVSGCDDPTDRLSAYITHFIQHLANNLPSHIKDRTFPHPHCKSSTTLNQCSLGHS